MLLLVVLAHPLLCWQGSAVLCFRYWWSPRCCYCVQATTDAFVLAAAVWGREMLLALLERCLCTASLVGQRAEIGCVLNTSLLKKDFSLWPISEGIHGIFSWLCSLLLRPWAGRSARRQTADFKRTLLTCACSEFGVGCLRFVFPFCLCWWCLNVFVFLFCLLSTIF